MNKRNILSKLAAAGFYASYSSDAVLVDIYQSTELQASYKTPCAEAVVLPLLGFCARYNLTMRRNGAICEVRA